MYQKLEYKFVDGGTVRLFIDNLSALQWCDKIHRPGITEFLNINTLIKKVNEIEKLKILLLNRGQYTCINFMTKPEISYIKKSRKLFKIENEDRKMTGDQKIENIIKYFCELEEINEGDINHKLLDIMHESIVNAIYTYVEDINGNL